MPYGEQINNNSGATKPTSVEANEHERELFAKRMMKVPVNYQLQIDYGSHTDGNMDYIGYAPKGASTSDAAWLVQKFTYQTISAVDYILTRKVAYGTWTGRAGLTYA